MSARVVLILGLVSCVATTAAAAPPAPLSFREPGRLVVIKETHLPEIPKMHVSPAMFRAWRERATSFESLAALTPATYNLSGAGEPLRVSSALVSVGLFATLGIRPALGRDFVAGEDEPGKADVAILGHAFWLSRFGGRADVLGRTLVFDGRRVAIVGVAPPGIEAPFAADIYRPLSYAPAMWAARGPHVIEFVIGRLKPGVRVDQAQAEVAGISAALPSVGIERRWGARVLSLADHLADLAGPRVTPRGFEPQGASVLNVTVARDRYTTGAQRAVFAQRLVDALAKVPGVSVAAGASALPLHRDEWANGFEVEGSPIPPTFPLGTTFSVTPGYFEAMRIPLLRGRGFDARDTAAAPAVAIISERAVKRWPAGTNPLGKRIRLYGDSRWLEVVGVVGEVSAGQYGRIETQVYRPFAQQATDSISMVIRSRTPLPALGEGVRAAVRAVDPAQPISELRPLLDTMVETEAPR